MKKCAIAGRTAKEILRDPLNIGFGLGFPLVLLLLMSTIQRNIPVPLFVLDTLTPGIMVFGLAFLTLFSATLIARDRETAFLKRLYTTPLRASDFILGYMLPFLPIALAQSLLCLLLSMMLGLAPSIHMLGLLLSLMPTAVFFISLGLLCGSVLGVKQVGGLCGALLTNLTGWLSGIWFDISLVGGVFTSIANALPFLHAVNLSRAALAGQLSSAMGDLIWVLSYAALSLVLSILLFLRQMRRK